MSLARYRYDLKGRRNMTVRRAHDWLDVLEALKTSHHWNRSRSQVAFLGCGAYGMPLGRHAVARGMSAVYVGGFLQVLFGIGGARYDRNGILRAGHPVAPPFHRLSLCAPALHPIPPSAPPHPATCPP